MKNTELRKLKYAIIRNITANTEIAYKARDWDYNRIYKEFGIDIELEVKGDVKTTATPEKKYKRHVSHRLVPFTTKSKREKLRTMISNKENYLIKKKVDEELIQTLKYRTYREIKAELNYRKKYYVDPQYKLQYHEKKERMDRWGDWSKDEAIEKYPYSITRRARMINLEHNLDINASFGFGMVYFAFTNNKSEEYFIKKYKYDPHTGEIIYNTAKPVRV